MMLRHDREATPGCLIVACAAFTASTFFTIGVLVMKLVGLVN